MTEKSYKNLINEGGEGYNPHSPKPVELDRSEKIDRLLRIMNATSSQDPRYLELKAEYDGLYEMDWSLDTTRARRASWNSYMLAAKKAGRKVDLHQVQAEMGFTFADLKEAIRHHNL